MKADFWHNKWEKSEIGFHENKVNPLLANHIHTLNLTADNRVFLPLCGKTKDIAWLRNQGFQVVGIELSEIAVIQLFEDLGEPPIIKPINNKQANKLTLYSAKNIDIYVGDFFDLDKQQLAKVDAVYDRASLIALPDTMREQYTKHLVTITAKSPQLLITLEYDQSALKGPPFSVTHSMLNAYYTNDFVITKLSTLEEEGKLKGKVKADNVIWHLLSKKE